MSLIDGQPVTDSARETVRSGTHPIRDALIASKVHPAARVRCGTQRLQPAAALRPLTLAALHCPAVGEKLDVLDAVRDVLANRAAVRVPARVDRLQQERCRSACPLRLEITSSPGASIVSTFVAIGSTWCATNSAAVRLSTQHARKPASHHDEP